MQSLDPPTNDDDGVGGGGTCWCSGSHGRLQSGGFGGRGRGRGGRMGEPRYAVMTAVLREAGLKQYPDIERVSDTLTIPDPPVVTHPRC